MMKNLFRLYAVAFVIFGAVAVGYSQTKPPDNSRISLMTKAVELVDVKSSAETCPGQKGVTITLRVVNDSPIDVVSYKKIGKLWGPSVYLNKQKGDSLTDFACYDKALFRIYSRAAGSSEAFPAPK